MPTSYRVRIDRGDVHFEAEGDKKFVLEMLARFEKPASTALSAAGRGGPEASSKSAKDKRVQASTPDVGKGLSPGEFIRQFGFKKHTDFVVAFGYYLEKHSGLTEFAAADINNCYYEAKMESSNTSQIWRGGAARTQEACALTPREVCFRGSGARSVAFPEERHHNGHEVRPPPC